MMKKSIILLILVLTLFGCSSGARYRTNNANSRIYYADVDGDGVKDVVEAEDKYSSNGEFIVTFRKDNKNGDVIDSFTVPGRVRDIKSNALNMDFQEWVFISFSDKDNVPGIAVYQLIDNSASKIFFATSEYKIEVDFSSVPKIKIGKPPKNINSPSLTPEWEIWFWSGDKFLQY